LELQISVTPGTLGEDGANDTLRQLGDLTDELTELDIDVGQACAPAPYGAKGLAEVTAVLTSVPASGIAPFIRFLRGWAGRTGRTVEVSFQGDAIKITGASKEQQDRLVEAWLDRHAPGT